MKVRVVAFEAMDDETSIRHLEHRHADDLLEMNIKFSPEPDRKGKPRRFRGGKSPWDRFHFHLHNWSRTSMNHDHEEPDDGA